MAFFQNNEFFRVSVFAPCRASVYRRKTVESAQAREELKVQKTHVFLLIWLGLFLASLYLLPSIGTSSLMSESFLNAVVVFAAAYLIFSLLRQGIPSRFFAAVLIILLVAAAYQNQGRMNASSVKNVFEVEASSISALGSVLGGVASIESQGGSEVPIQFSIPPGLLRSAPPAPPFRPVDPTILNGHANVTFPDDYGAMVDSVLGSINKERANSNLPPVSLSGNAVGQQHANSMQYFNYYSHWDTQGYKPYMRYTLLGGSGDVSENIALSYCTIWPAHSPQVFPSTCTTPTLENALNNSEWQMVHNDLGCCNNGHRDNILNPFHNKVSLGIAYNVDTHQVYLVEDFENSYLSIKQPLYSSGRVTLSGTMTRALELYSIAVVYDTQPEPLSAMQLARFPHSYDAGLPIGAVFAPCASGYICPPTTVDGGVAVYATNWQESAGDFTIQFDVSSFVQKQGSGVYTLYLFDADKNILTSISVFAP
jgi:hypothetical protein